MGNKRINRTMLGMIATTLTLILFFANCTTAFATDEAEQTVGDTVTVYDDSNPSATSITPRSDAGSYTTKTLVSTAYKKMVFARYETSDWLKTPYYMLAVGREFDFSFSYTYEGVGLSIAFSKNITATARIDADKTRYSKLASYADFTIKKYRVKRYTTGGVLINSYYSYQTITTNTYIKPKYQ